MPERLPDDPPQLFVDEALLPSWDPSRVSGYDVQAAPTTEPFIPVGKDLDDVGAVYPHLTVQFSTETSPGSTTYNYLNHDGTPGQDRSGQLVVTARAEERSAGYSGDSDTYDTVDADDLVESLIAEVEAAALANATSESTLISPLGSERGADAPNDYEVEPPVMIAQCTVAYHWSRD